MDEEVPKERKWFTFFDTKEEANERLSCTLMGCVLFPVLGLGLLALSIILSVLLGIVRMAWMNF
jgi:hypothetical protein